MAPRKSVARTPKRTAASHASAMTAPMASGIATSSKVTLDSLPLPDLPPTVTPGYVRQPEERMELDEEERGRLIHELVGLDARILVNEITENAREVLTAHVNGIEAWALEVSRKMKDPLVSREVKIGMHAFETLLESHVDKAFDKFAAWALRNAFEIPSDAPVVLPWHQGLDFPRAAYITSLPRGADQLEKTIDDLRSRTEQARLLSLRLAKAEQLLDRRLEIARQRKKEVGFVKEVLDASHLTPLPPKTEQIHASLLSLHSTLSTLSALDPNTLQSGNAGTRSAGSADGNPASQKAWELGRQAYLNWAVGKLVDTYAEPGAGAPAGAGGKTDAAAGAAAAGTEREKVGEVERMMRERGGRPEDVERLARSVQ